MRFRTLVSLTVGGALLVGLSPAPVVAVPMQDGDGVATPAACAALGFDLPGPMAGGYAAGPRPPGTSGRTGPGTGPMPAPPAVLSAPAPHKLQVRGETMPGRPPVVAPSSTERYPDAPINAVVRTADQPVSTFSIDVDTASYANVRRFLREGHRPPRDAVRAEEMINYFDYDLARPATAEEAFAVTATLVDSPWNPGRRILHVALQGYELPEHERRPLNLTFMVDVSGSMNAPDKLGLAQAAMNLAIDRLRPQDTVAITTYASGARVVLGPTPGTQKLKLRCAVASLWASGATAGAAGMVTAYDQAEAAFGPDKVNRILMFTDGDFNVGVTEDKRLEDYVADKRRTGIYLSVYGFGRGNYQDARMQAIAQAGNGVAAYVDDLDEARRLFGPAFDRGAFPIADDVKVQVEFNPAWVGEWRLIGYETRLLNEADFGNDRIDAGEVGSGATVVALYEITPAGTPGQLPDRRYGQPSQAGDASREWAFVQVRYKRPGEDRSQLIRQPVTGPETAPGTEVRWAIAVAGAAQLLRGDPWMSADHGWDQVIALALGARGDDPWGQRAQFVNLARAAAALGPVRAP